MDEPNVFETLVQVFSSEAGVSFETIFGVMFGR